METLDCGKLTAGVVALDCHNPLVQGVKGTALIFNHDDIDLDATTIDASGVMTELKLKAGASAYWVKTKDGGIDTNIAFVKGTYYDGFDQNFVLRLFDNTPAIKAFLNELAILGAKVCVVVQNKYVKMKPTAPELKGETVYELFGFYTGLELNELTRDSTDTDTKGGYAVTLGCDENQKEPSLPITVFKTSLSATDDMLNALVVTTP